MVGEDSVYVYVMNSSLDICQTLLLTKESHGLVAFLRQNVRRPAKECVLSVVVRAHSVGRVYLSPSQSKLI